MSEQRLPDPRMRDEFRRELRAQLMRDAAVILVPRRRDNAWTTWFRPALAAGLATLVLVMGAGSAAAGSVPGDVSFGLKRAIEEVRVVLAFDEVERVRLLAEIADQRLSELDRVAARDDRAPTASEEYAEAVTRFREAVDALQEAAPDEDKSELAQLVADLAREKHELVLERLRARLPEKAQESVDRAIEVERRDTPNTKGKKDRIEQNQKEGSSPGNGAEPRGNGRSDPPRPSAPPFRRP